MGNAPSQQEVVEPPPEWDPESNVQKFELVSPMSDLSDPSMFLHRRSHLKSSAAVGPLVAKKGGPTPTPTIHRTGPAAIRQTPAADRRRKSKVIATRDSAYKHESRPRELAPPSAFYFPNVPTKESEDLVNRVSSSTGRRVSKQSKDSTGIKHQKSEENNGNNNSNNKENSKKNTPLFQKAKRKVTKAKMCLTGCLEESNQKVQIAKNYAKQRSKRGEKLASEVGTQSKIVSVRESETIDDQQNTSKKPEESFDPYNQKGKPTVMQFLDGTEKELRFNPVWRESHEGTYYEASTTTTGPNRMSDPTTAASSWKRESEVTGAESKRISPRLSNPSRPSYDSSVTTKIYEDLEMDKENLVHRAPQAPGENTADKPLLKSNNIRLNSTTRELSEDISSKDITSSVYSKRESLSSLATSHESTYWNCYYKQQVQVLHEEDAYFERLMFTSQPAGAMPEPSPMAGEYVVATPVAALVFDQGKPEQNTMLGKMDRSDATDDSQQSDIVSQATEVASRDNEPRSDIKQEASSNNDSVCRDLDVPDDEKDGGNGTFGSSSFLLNPKTGQSKQVTVATENKPQKKASCPVDLDITPFSSVVGSYNQSPGDSTLKTTSVAEEASDHPSDEAEDGSFLDTTAAFDEQRMQRGQMASVKFGHSTTGEDIQPQKRLSANQVLIQTKLIKNASSKPRPEHKKHVASKSLIKETPERSIDSQRSFGSAYSYKDKDVFTPVTASMTYPKGSPFRPRFDLTKKTMAKASLEQSAMFTQSEDNMSRTSRDMEIQATESAPSMIESRDYRDIAFGCFLQDTPNTLVMKKERADASYSPGLMSLDSPASVTLSPGQPLLSEQAMNNAAFLFSPSYASSHSLLTNGKETNKQEEAHVPKRIEQGRRESGFTISTLGSRSRLSMVSARSQSVTIPVNIQKHSLQGNSTSSDSASAAQKSVRFSSDGTLASYEDTHSQTTRKSVKFDFGFGKAPDQVDVPAIETKVSDLSDTTSVFRESTDSIQNIPRQSTIIEEETTSSVSSESPRSSATSATGSPGSNGEPILPSSPLIKSRTTPEQVLEAAGPESPESNNDTPEQVIGTWTYNKFSRGVTPMIGKVAQSKISNSPVLRFKAAKRKFGKPENEKVVPVKKASPLFKTRRGRGGIVHAMTQKFDKGPALVPTDIVSTNTKSFSSSASAASGASNSATDRPLMRTPQILGYKPKTYPNIFQSASHDSVVSNEARRMEESSGRTSLDTSTCKNSSRAKTVTTNGQYGETVKARTWPNASSLNSFAAVVEDEGTWSSPPEEVIPEDDYEEKYSDEEESLNSTESNEESTFIAASVATLRQEDRRTPALVADDEESLTEMDGFEETVDKFLADSQSIPDYPNLVERDHDQESVPDDEADDDFADLLVDNVLEDGDEKEQIHAVVPEDEEDSTFTNLMMTRTYSEDESTTMSSLLAQQIEPKLRSGAAVKPEEQQVHRPAAPSTGSLYLSPIQRTPMQSRKWRELAASAQKQDSKKWGKGKKSGKGSSKKGGIFRRSSGLSVRDTNVIGHD